MTTLRSYAPPALAAVAGAALVAALLAVAGWPGPTSWCVVHVALGGGLSGAWVWTQQHGTEQAGLVVAWWPPVMGGAIVVLPVLAHEGGMLAAGAAGGAVVVAVVSVWVARDCARRLGSAPPGVAADIDPDGRIHRLSQVEDRLARHREELERAASPAVREWVRAHRSDEGEAPRVSHA